ncbi:hypothetical protein CH275_28420 [Rhodococcus sp. 06-235-1A]|uniref:DUF4288 domain-containing protein n=1 Tax=Rhodococcus sp. 06-235-1A TaxID=2022508 RepID=UPI000B9B0D1E|nr:DUF4288 domain-containing protein [Rhodococcus sp. 06-235-1A]OZC94882.1 hypothetical protein CH275_28420 [Rhodococcus sp. 06-235-1A]
MNAAKQTYVGIVVFELGKTAGDGKYYREDFYVVHAESVAAARKTVEKRVHELEYAAGTGDDRSYVRLAHLVDVAPTLQDPTEDVVDLYSRHFASLETYSEFEMMLGGRDPLTT